MHAAGALSVHPRHTASVVDLPSAKQYSFFPRMSDAVRWSALYVGAGTPEKETSMS
jgi:hypothetical protein